MTCLSPSVPRLISTILNGVSGAGEPPTVTRPLIEAVRGRLSRCGVCALDWLTATRSDIDRVEKRLSGLGFIWRLLCSKSAQLLNVVERLGLWSADAGCRIILR